MKKFTKSLCVFAALLFGAVSMNVSANVATLKNQDLATIEDGVFTGHMNHARFLLKGVGENPNAIKNAKAGSAFQWDVTILDLGEADKVVKNYTMTFIPNADCNIRVKKVTFVAKMYNAIPSVDCWLSINNGKQTKIGSLNINSDIAGYTTVSANVADGQLEIPFTMYRTDASAANTPLLIKQIDVEYDIIPNAPAMIGSEQTIPVTLDPADPQTFNVVSSFQNRDSHYTIKYVASEGGELLNGTDFFAQKAGVYSVYAYVDSLINTKDDSKSCHKASPYSNPLMVTVERANPTLVLKEEHLDTVEVTIDPAQPIYFDIYNTIEEYVGDGLAYEVIAGDKSTGHCVDSAFYATALGEYTIRISSLEGDQYESAYKDIVVTVKQAVPVFDSNFDAAALMVGDTINNAFRFSSIIPASMRTSLSVLSLDPINNGVDSVVKIDPMTNSVIAVNAGKAHFIVEQDATPLVHAAFIEYYFTVSKYENKFVIIMDEDTTNMAHMRWNDGIYAYIYPSNADSAYDVVNGEGADAFATYYPEDDQIWAAEMNGMAKWYLRQNEDFKYLAAEDSMMVIVEDAEPGCVIPEINYAESEESVNTYGIQYIPEGGNGVAGTLTFNARKQAGELSTTMSVWQQVDGEWSQAAEITGLENNSKTYSVDLDPNATAFTFNRGASILTKFVKRVRLSRNTYLKPAQDTIIIYDILRDSTVSASFDLAYSTCAAYTIKLESENSHVSVDAITTNESEAKTISVPVSYTAGAEQEFGMDTLRVRIYNSSYDTSIVVLAEIVEKTRLQIAREAANDTIDSIAKEILGEQPELVPQEQKDSLDKLVEEIKEEINNASPIEEVEKAKEEGEKKLEEFVNGIKDDDKKKIDDEVEKDLVLSEDPYQELPLSDEVKELMEEYKDSLDKASSLDEMESILQEALDTIQKQIGKEKQDLYQARQEGKGDIDEKVADIKGHDELQDFVPEPWAEKLNELANESKQNIDSCVTPEQVGDTVLYAQNKFDDLFEEFRQQAKDSVVSGMSAFQPFSQQMQAMLDTTLARLDTVGNIYDMLEILSENTYNVFDQYAKEQSEFEFNEDYDNTEFLESHIGDVRDVQINTTFEAGMWTTICLPFNLDNFIGTPFEGCEVVAMASSLLNDANDTLLVNVKHVTSIAAGVPYIVRPQTALESPVFEDVTIAASEGLMDIAGAISFIGTMAPIELMDNYSLTMEDNNPVLNYVEGEESVMSFRAYFMVDESVYADFIPVKIVLDKEVVGLHNVQHIMNVKKYLDRNGRMIILRDKVRYSALGQVIR